MKLVLLPLLLLCWCSLPIRGVHLQASIRDELILYIDKLPIDTPRLVRTCFYSIPARYRQACRDYASSLYRSSLYASKRTCCTRWAEMDCMKKHLYNSIYCDTNQQRMISRFFKTIQRISLAHETGDCLNYPPMEIDTNPIFRHAGLQPRCSPRGVL